MQEFKQRIKLGSKSLNISVLDHQADMMILHAKELMAWNKKINLTAIKEPLLIAEKHFIDSIAAASFLGKETCLMDMGSGGGFPGIPIKIMKSSLKVVLIDSSRKKVNFLKHIIRILHLENIDAIHARVEDLHENEKYKNKFDAVISRAFNELSSFIALSSPFLSNKGVIYAMKGKHADQEITPAILEKFDLQTNHYQLPFEKSDRYMIKLSVKE
ncbi:MAG: 16S rRNA (guanine(527)-N(7))-methyltransferase RsmG [Desulfobacula sp.]|nr:16S rRNA (guanine(527)-N(7))-methyltransferase RsmG [Desulfobacula sp.]